jgi:hypothetical protein
MARRPCEQFSVSLLLYGVAKTLLLITLLSLSLEGPMLDDACPRRLTGETTGERYRCSRLVVPAPHSAGTLSLSLLLPPGLPTGREVTGRERAGEGAG